MKRRAVIATCILVVAGVRLASAQDKYAPAGTLFSVSVPLKFQAVNVNMSHVAVRCDLRGYTPDFVIGSDKPLTLDFRSQPVRTFVAKGGPPNLILFPLAQLFKGTLEAPYGQGGYYQGTATILFASSDFALNPAGLNDPSLVTEIYCQFGLRGKDGLLYQPAFDPAYVRMEIDNFRMAAPQEYVGRVPLTQPPVTAWPPALAPTPQIDPAKKPYQWHAAWILPLPQWLR